MLLIIRIITNEYVYPPPHPGEFIKEVFLEPYGISYRTVAAKLKVSPSTFHRLIKQQKQYYTGNGFTSFQDFRTATGKLVNYARQL